MTTELAPEVQEAADRLRDLWQKEASLRGRLETVRARPRRDSVELEARRLLGEQTEEPDARPTEEELAELAHRLRVVQTAVELQKQRVEQAKHEAARRLGKVERKRYEDVVRRLAKALRQVGSLADEEAKFWEELTQRSGGSTNWRVEVETCEVGDRLRLNVEGSWLNDWLKHAAEHYKL